MTTTINAPATQTQMDSAGVTYSYVFARQALLMAMVDMIDPIGTGMVALKGDLGGQDTDTLRITEVDDIGWARRFTALTGETDTITASPYTLGYTEVTVGMYGLSHEDSYNRQVLSSGATAVSLDQLIASVPASFLATLRYSACVTGATISASVGSAVRTLDVDDHLDLATAIRGTPGAASRGVVRCTLDPTQLDNLVRSYRTEPAFSTNAQSFADITRIIPGQVYPNFAGVGIDILTTDDVQQSGGAYQGFAQSPGGIGWGRASTDRIRPSGAGRALYIPEFGLFLQEHDRGEQAKARYDARAWMGTALGSTNVFFLSRVLSIAA